jgi:hypothetical protein
MRIFEHMESRAETIANLNLYVPQVARMFYGMVDEQLADPDLPLRLLNQVAPNLEEVLAVAVPAYVAFKTDALITPTLWKLFETASKVTYGTEFDSFPHELAEKAQLNQTGRDLANKLLREVVLAEKSFIGKYAGYAENEEILHIADLMATGLGMAKNLDLVIAGVQESGEYELFNVGEPLKALIEVLGELKKYTAPTVAAV